MLTGVSVFFFNIDQRRIQISPADGIVTGHRMSHIFLLVTLD